MDRNTTDFTQKLAICTDIEQSRDLMRVELDKLGFTSFIYAQVIKNADGSMADVISADTLRPDWMEFYFSHGLVDKDYATFYCMQSTTGVDFAGMFNEININPELEGFRTAAEATQDFGYKNGRSIPITHMKRRSSLLTIYSPTETNTCEHIANIELNHATLSNLIEAFDAQMDLLNLGIFHYGLTGREIEVLKWLSDGHMPKHIAEKTSTSVNTINKQILSAKSRLECVTTTQAVAKALILGII